LTGVHRCAFFATFLNDPLLGVPSRVFVSFKSEYCFIFHETASICFKKNKKCILSNLTAPRCLWPLPQFPRETVEGLRGLWRISR
jgi:hypothetical protein